MADIYYIEDDSHIAGAVKEYLEKKGFRVTICGTLAEAEKDKGIPLPIRAVPEKETA